MSVQVAWFGFRCWTFCAMIRVNVCFSGVYRCVTESVKSLVAGGKSGIKSKGRPVICYEKPSRKKLRLSTVDIDSAQNYDRMRNLSMLNWKFFLDLNKMKSKINLNGHPDGIDGLNAPNNFAQPANDSASIQ